MMSKTQLIRIFCFIALVVLGDQLTGRLMRKLYFMQGAGQNANLNYSLQDCKADILILGNSRAQHHYDTQILSDSVKMSSFNAGMDGGHSILLPDAILKVVLKRYRPKCVLLEFNPSSMAYHALDYEKLSILLPYYKPYPELRQLILMKGPWERFKLVSEIYPFNSDLIDLIRFGLVSKGKIKIENNGFSPFKNKVMNAKMLPLPLKVDPKEKADPHKIEALLDIIRLCKENKVKLYLINSPTFQDKVIHADKDAEMGKEIFAVLKNENAEYHDFSNDSTFLGRMDLFADAAHLNEKGAILYSQKIGKLLKTQLGQEERKQ